jgi:serine/threonine protein kinase
MVFDDNGTPWSGRHCTRIVPQTHRGGRVLKLSCTKIYFIVQIKFQMFKKQHFDEFIRKCLSSEKSSRQSPLSLKHYQRASHLETRHTSQQCTDENMSNWRNVGRYLFSHALTTQIIIERSWTELYTGVCEVSVRVSVEGSVKAVQFESVLAD